MSVSGWDQCNKYDGEIGKHVERSFIGDNKAIVKAFQTSQIDANVFRNLEETYNFYSITSVTEKCLINRKS